MYPDSTTKRCPRCKQELPATPDCFGRNKRCQDGLGLYCRPCKKSQNREHRVRHGLPVRTQRRKDGLKQCAKCERWLPATAEFFHKGQGGDNLRPDCKDCSCAGARLWRSNNTDRARESSRAWSSNNRPKIALSVRKWRKNHPEQHRKINDQWLRDNPDKARAISRRRGAMRKARKLNTTGDYTSEDIRKLLDQQKGRCWYCGVDISGYYEVEHRIPLSRGGTNELNNICLSCRHCNRSKGSQLPHEWSGRLL
jgi:hypothetical protein